MKIGGRNQIEDNTRERSRRSSREQWKMRNRRIVASKGEMDATDSSQIQQWTEERLATRSRLPLRGSTILG